MIIGKYSMGIGDRFGQQGRAQLSAFLKAKEMGVDVTPVWNKSYREHAIIGTGPADTRAEADAAVKALNWGAPYFVDADHVSLKIIDPFVPVSDFFTLDVADFIGEKAATAKIETFVKKQSRFIGSLSIPGIDAAFTITEELIRAIGEKYLFAVQEAGKIYRRVATEKGAKNFVTEVSMDETDEPQTPVQMLFILAAIADEGIPAQTIAPKFTGRFNKGVDYVGDVDQFSKEFEQDLAVIKFAVREFSLPANLKLSVHSGSDKFSIYGPIARAIRKFDAGLHIKTAGTTWLEELIGLAEGGGDGLLLAKEKKCTAKRSITMTTWSSRTPRSSTLIKMRCLCRMRSTTGTAPPTPRHCATIRAIRNTINIFASFCTSATRSRHKSASAIWPQCSAMKRS